LKKTSLRPLRQGQRLDTSETKQSSSKERKPPKTKLEQPQRAPPAHMQAPPEPMHLPLDECMQTSWKQGSCCNFSSHRSSPPVRPVPKMCTGPALRPVTPTGQTGAQQSPEMARNHLKTF
jgi:hypothetical protein